MLMIMKISTNTKNRFLCLIWTDLFKNKQFYVSSHWQHFQIYHLCLTIASVKYDNWNMYSTFNYFLQISRVATPTLIPFTSIADHTVAFHAHCLLDAASWNGGRWLFCLPFFKLSWSWILCELSNQWKIWNWV